MTTFLYSIPDGWAITVISISVVFLGLTILYGIYSLSGAVFSRRLRKNGKNAEADEDTVAAIALALKIHGREVRGQENRKITIQGGYGPWSDKSLTFRKKTK